MANRKPAEIAETARQICTDGPIVARKFQHWRPLICPYHELLDLVPGDSRILDVGCGSGLFLGLLAATGSIAQGVGFDNSATAIDMARLMSKNLPNKRCLSFLLRDATEQWPDGAFDVVSMIDVMHHVPRVAQRAVFANAASRVAPGKWFLYKDMGRRPVWRAAANRLHDLVVAQEWINYVDLANILTWAEQEGLALHTRQSIDMLWYRHELVLFQRPALICDCKENP